MLNLFQHLLNKSSIHDFLFSSTKDFEFLAAFTMNDFDLNYCFFSFSIDEKETKNLVY